jgi:hypothetical protein
MNFMARHPTSPATWPGELPVTNRYTFGLAGEKFFQMIKERGQFLGTRCPHCQRIYVPATSFCERCFCELDEWIEIEPTGEVDTYTILSVDSNGLPFAEPVIIAFIRIQNGGIIHRLAEVMIDDVFFGMPVKAVLKPPAERQGSILDILYFKPL